MTAGVLDRIASFFSTDVVKVIIVSNAGEEVQQFPDAIPMKVSVNRQARLFKSPLETSVNVTDHKVIDQDLITLSLIIPNGLYKETYQLIDQIFIRSDSLTIQTKAATYDNMIIQAMPHEENPEYFDAITMNLALEETQFATLNVVTLPADKVSEPQQSDTQDRGTQNPVEPGQSVAAQIRDSLSDAIGSFSGLFGG